MLFILFNRYYFLYENIKENLGEFYIKDYLKAINTNNLVEMDLLLFLSKLV